jgi:hypothetical protein
VGQALAQKLFLGVLLLNLSSKIIFTFFGFPVNKNQQGRNKQGNFSRTCKAEDETLGDRKKRDNLFRAQPAGRQSINVYDFRHVTRI